MPNADGRGRGRGTARDRGGRCRRPGPASECRVSAGRDPLSSLWTSPQRWHRRQPRLFMGRLFPSNTAPNTPYRAAGRRARRCGWRPAGAAPTGGARRVHTDHRHTRLPCRPPVHAHEGERATDSSVRRGGVSGAPARFLPRAPVSSGSRAGVQPWLRSSVGERPIVDRGAVGSIPAGVAHTSPARPSVIRSHRRTDRGRRSGSHSYSRGRTGSRWQQFLRWSSQCLAFTCPGVSGQCTVARERRSRLRRLVRTRPSGRNSTD